IRICGEKSEAGPAENRERTKPASDDGIFCETTTDAERTFFSSIERLKRLDQLTKAVDAYVDLLAARVFDAIDTKVTALTGNPLANRWRVVKDKGRSSP